MPKLLLADDSVTIQRVIELTFSGEDVQVIAPVRREVVERRPAPAPRVRRNAVVVDLDDEDPAFHELDEPGEGPYRRAVGE